MGTVVRLAQQIADAAQPGEVWVSPAAGMLLAASDVPLLAVPSEKGITGAAAACTLSPDRCDHRGVDPSRRTSQQDASPMKPSMIGASDEAASMGVGDLRQSDSESPFRCPHRANSSSESGDSLGVRQEA
jgi:hypothetical protein